MAKMWKGPCEALRAAHADPLWAAIHRRAGRQGVFMDIDLEATIGTFFTIENGYKRVVGQVRGSDPMLIALHGYHRFTDSDSELFEQHHTYLLRLADEIASDVALVIDKLGKAFA